MEFGGFFWITIMNDLVKPSQTQSNPDMPTHRADASGLPDGADAGREARPAARGGACAPLRKKSQSPKRGIVDFHYVTTI